jgi:2-polyprenyl-3-methyl-5-hydroxy-6-metoxy-1,4-benzoquinol methylase
MRWSDIASDPNSARAVEFRRVTLQAARMAPVADRCHYLAQLVVGRRVLDIGVADHVASHSGRDDWLHAIVAKAAAYCLGVDVLSHEVEELRAQGYNVICQDITKTPLGEQFDFMICGELVEHLSEPGRLFAAAVWHLKPGGRLVVTTPNPYYLPRIRDALLNRIAESVDHVCLYWPSGIAELGERHGFRLVRYRGVEAAGARTLLGRIVLVLLRAVSRFFHNGRDVLCHTWIFELQLLAEPAASLSTVDN